MSNALKNRIVAGQKTRALWLETGSPDMAEAAVYSGFRHVLIDNEHGPAGNETTAHMLRAINAAGGHAMVRVPGHDPLVIKRTMELGLESIMIPSIHTAEDAGAAVAACRYPPHGLRGFAGEIRASRYGTDSAYPGAAKDRLFLMLQIESIEGVNNAEEIAKVEGIDMIFIGPYDLSGTHGVLGETNHPDVEKSIAHVIGVAQAAGLPLGTVPRAGKDVHALMAGPFDLVISESEIGHAIAAMRTDAKGMEPGWLG
ncbi:HpcH/HpaI aldolase/citrate lyase family protein [Oceaniovalibus sp. ACAM 378]|uniref:HpcH/HpaI aldolase family protein n=1 Tax=Oceaniovalibus sp. ACAM 378 TaxID=2599923 RepID=UPI001651CA59|nr:aldolase/citrate lyase family protein [Oceaniovalibus sp. ACAM 378]